MSEQPTPDGEGIIVYTAPQCQACKATTQRFQDKGVPFTEKPFAEQPPEKQAQLKRDVGARAPLVVTADHGSWAGMNPQKIREVVADEGTASPSKAAPVMPPQVSPAPHRAGL